MVDVTNNPLAMKLVDEDGEKIYQPMWFINDVIYVRR